MQFLWLVTTDTGFESVLTWELESKYGVEVQQVSSGRVIFKASLASGIEAVLRSRLVNNAYLILEYVEGVSSLDDVYRVVKSIDFTQFIDPNQSFAIRPERIGEHTFTSIDIARVAGQAVIDSYMESTGVRLRVNLDYPDVEVYTELNEDRLIVALNILGESLHRRGYRVYNHPAALKSTIASAMVYLSGWNGGKPLLDPMCGSGTIVIEAILSSLNVPPCCYRKKFSFQRLKLLREVGRSVMDRLAKLCSPHYDGVLALGIDINPKHIEGAIANAIHAGVAAYARFTVGDCRKLGKLVDKLSTDGTPPSVLVTNPPYGQRMYRHNLDELYYTFLKEARDSGIDTVVFITSAIDTAERAIQALDPRTVDRLYVLHGTLPSYVYLVRF